VAFENLAAAYPELPEPERRRIALGAYQSVAMTLIEGFLGYQGLPKDTLVLENWDVFDQALAEGRGVILTIPHSGPWELFGQLLVQRGCVISVVTRQLKGSINTELLRARLKTGGGGQLIPTKGAILGTAQAVAKG